MHSVLEHLFDEPAHDRTLDKARSLIKPQWEDLVGRDPRVDELRKAEGDEAWFGAMERFVTTYFDRENPQNLQPTAENRERMITVDLPTGIRFRGVIDRVDVSPHGDLRVVDYKTGKKPHPRFQGDALFQLKVYGLLLELAEGKRPVQSQLIYLGSNETLTYWTDDNDSEAATDKIMHIWSAILESLEQGFEPRQSKLCDWCSFQDVCPVFGGTIPEIDPAGVEKLSRVAIN